MESSLSDAEKKKEQPKTNTMSVYKNYEDLIKKLDSVKVKQQEQTDDKPKRPEFKYTIPLSDELLDEIYNQCLTNDIPYSLVLAIAGVESDYNPKAVSKTSDFGLMQVHSTNIKDFAIDAGIVNVDPFNPEHSTRMATVYLKYLKDYWNQYDMSDEQKFFCIVLSYNIGENKVEDYIKHHGYKNTYVTKVLHLKNELEQNEVNM
jgi:hypothetical protein